MRPNIVKGRFGVFPEQKARPEEILFRARIQGHGLLLKIRSAYL